MWVCIPKLYAKEKPLERGSNLLCLQQENEGLEYICSYLRSLCCVPSHCTASEAMCYSRTKAKHTTAVPSTGKESDVRVLQEWRAQGIYTRCTAQGPNQPLHPLWLAKHISMCEVMELIVTTLDTLNMPGKGASIWLFSWPVRAQV